MKQRQPGLTARLPLTIVLAGWRDGDELGWPREFEWLREHDAMRTNRLLASVRQVGILRPVLLGHDGRV